MSTVISSGEKLPDTFRATCPTCRSVSEFCRSELSVRYIHPYSSPMAGEYWGGYYAYVECPNEDCGTRLRKERITAYPVYHYAFVEKAVLITLGVLGFAAFVALAIYQNT